MAIPKLRWRYVRRGIFIGLAVFIGVLIYLIFFYQSTTLTENDHFQEIHYKVGQVFTVKLQSTFWQHIDTTYNGYKIIKPIGDIKYTPCKEQNVPGSGCGTSERKFVGIKPGDESIGAYRSVCGEAIICAHDQGSVGFDIKIEP